MPVARRHDGRELSSFSPSPFPARPWRGGAPRVRRSV